MIALLEHFNLEVNGKVSFRSNDSKLGILFFNKHLAGTTTTRNMYNCTA